MIYNGDCLEVLKSMPDASVDSLVTDPPAGISFMGKAWDGDRGGRDEWIKWLSEVMRECLRVMKPGAHGLVWAIPRTSHWTATALENAGFEVKDQVFHLFGSGFPKSLNVKKSAQKAGIACVCGENVRDLSDRLDSEDALSSESQSDVQPHMLGEANQAKRSNATKAKTAVPDLRKGVLHSKQNAIQGQVLLSDMLGQKLCTTAKTVRGKHARTKSGSAVRSSQSSLEGWSHLQAEQGQLHRSEVCSVSDGIPADGSQGRLCDGAQAGDGDSSRALSESRGSRASQGPQYAEQLHNELGTIPGQPRPQTCGSCGKAIFQEGTGTALKPAAEVWILVRKPLGEKTVAKNVLKHGTGGLNIDASRIGTADTRQRTGKSALGVMNDDSWKPKDVIGGSACGRFPANLVLSHNPECVETTGGVSCSPGCAVAMLDAQSGIKQGSGKLKSTGFRVGGKSEHSVGLNGKKNAPDDYGDSGGASRFFYCAKASKSDKNAGLEGMEKKAAHTMSGGPRVAKGRTQAAGKTEHQNHHPTVKSTKLMTYLIRLVTPKGGTVLDCFAGSGSTGVAAVMEGFQFVGIEREREYAEIAEKRMEAAV